MLLREHLLPVLFLTMLSAADKQEIAPPIAKKIARSETLHGDARTDNYFWLRDRSNPEVLRYLEDENKYTDAVMKHTDELQQKLYSEILGRIKETDLTVPEKRDTYEYYSRTEKGKQYSIYCRRRLLPEAGEEVLLDSNALAEGRQYFRLGTNEVSPDHRLLAYSTDTDGSEVYTLFVKDLGRGDLLPDRIPNTYYSLAWANDNKTFFYTTLDSAKRPYRVYRHTLGVDPKSDALVYEEKDEKFNVELDKTRSERFILATSESHTATEVRYLSADQPGEQFRVLEPRRPEVEYYVEHHGDSFYIRTNEQAKNFRLMQTPVKDPSRANWRELIAERKTVVLERVEAFRNHLVFAERDNGLVRLRISDTNTKQSHFVDFPEPVYRVSLGRNLEYDTAQLRFTYTSLVTPSSVYDYDMDAKTRQPRKRQEVLGGYDPALYASERIMAHAPDGTSVPLSLVYRKSMQKNGKNPLYLYGYGSYGLTLDPSFSSDRLSLLDRGFIYAIAHIRGGGDMSRYWYDDGKLLKKKNTFRDFIASAEELIAQKYTSSDRLVISGASAGGLLMGAVTNMRPTLFRAVIAKVPFVDVINTMLDASIPLTVTEYEEWGNPQEQQYYEYIKSYAPYENIEAKSYPDMLVTAGLNDPRVPYWEPAKLVAKLRAVKKDHNTLLLKTNLGAGHGGPSGRYDRLKETAFEFAFILDRLGLYPEQTGK